MAFCDLIDSTQLEDEINPEDTSDALKQYHAYAKAAVDKFGDRVAQFLDAGVFCYSG